MNNVAVNPAIKFSGWKLRQIAAQASALTLTSYDAVRVYFEPSIQSLKVRENLDHLKVNKEKEMKGREILFYIVFSEAQRLISQMFI